MRSWILQHTAIRIEKFSNDVLHLIELIGVVETMLKRRVPLAATLKTAPE